jgi:hypothetical protein
VSALHAARVAARLRKAGYLVEQRSGAYGEFTVLVDGKEVLAGGPLGWLGVLPSFETVLATLRVQEARA